ncbi:MAG: hypothetical protein U0793_09400 [Gemmataceae bacterium]
MDRPFSDWRKWLERNAMPDLGYPGVYALATSPTDLSATPFSWPSEIVYVGMTNAKGGLKARLKQFEDTIRGREGHGGAQRVRFKHRDYQLLTAQLFVSVCPYACDVKNDPENLRIMGEVAKHEYECFALFVERFGSLPEFNDKQKSPKK